MKRATVPMRASYNRMHRRLRQAEARNRELKEAAEHFASKARNLQQRLEVLGSVEVPEYMLDKVITSFTKALGEEFARRALEQGADVDPRSLVYAAKKLIEGGLSHMTVCSRAGDPFRFLAGEGLEEGSLKFSFSMAGPISMNYGMSAFDVKSTLPFGRYHAKSANERYYRLDALPAFFEDRQSKSDDIVKGRDVFPFR